MAKIIPDGQTFNDLRTGEQVFITRVTLSGAATDHVVLPSPANDAALLGANEAASDALGFYLGGGSKSNVANIDGGTAGDEFLVVSRHVGMVNFGSE